MKKKGDEFAADELGRAIDRLDSAACGLALPLPLQMHVTQLKTILPEIVTEMKAAFVKVTGGNPWK